MASVWIQIGENKVELANVETYEQARAAFELLASSLPRADRWEVSFDRGPTAIHVIKAIREMTGLGLKDAKEVADRGSYVLTGEVVARGFAARVADFGAAIKQVRKVG
jgi:ribosomal protein L7/L12